MASTSTTSPAAAEERARRVSIGFINWAHAIDHYVMLILATVAQRFRLELSPRARLRIEPSIALRPRGVRVIVRERD